MSGGAETGFFGKLPALGDFVQRGLSRDFTAPWDAWLQRALATSRAQLGEQWLDVYLTSPLWRFVLDDAACGEGAWAGVMMPSVDKVGRYFPLTVAVALPNDSCPFEVMTGGEDWFVEVESLMLGALDAEELDVDAFDARLQAVTPLAVRKSPRHRTARLSDGWRVDLPQGLHGAAPLASALALAALPNASLWFNSGTEHAQPLLMAYAGMPAPDGFVDLLLGGADSVAVDSDYAAVGGD